MAAAGVQGLRFSVRMPDGRNEVLTVDSDKVLVGSGAHCEIRLPAEHASVEHLEITMSVGAVYAQARAADRLPLLNGVEFMQSPVLPGSVISIGGCQMEVAVVEISDNPQVIKKKQEKTSPVTYLALILAIPLAGWLILDDDGEKGPPKMPKDPPALWAKAAATCPVSDVDEASAVASDKWVSAEGKAERRPFRVQDGVQAVPLYEAAAACFDAAGKTDEAASAKEAGTQLRRKVNEDYRAHQVRLEHALNVKDLATAQKEVKILRAFTEGLAGQYVDWLAVVERQIQLKLGEKKS
jgi:hypothetical protein